MNYLLRKAGYVPAPRSLSVCESGVWTPPPGGLACAEAAALVAGSFVPTGNARDGFLKTDFNC